MRATVFAALLAALPGAAYAGPPFVTDDPQPTDYQHYEVYFFAGGTAVSAGSSSAAGIDFNYGGVPNLQLTAVVPVERDDPAGADSVYGLGNIQLAAKYRFARGDQAGWDIAVFPRLFLPAASANVGDRHASVFLPIYAEKDWDRWSTFGGGGCALNHGGDATDFCTVGWVLVHKATEHLQLGAEVYYQGADTRGGKASTGMGAGFTYDLGEHLHLMGSLGPGLQNAAQSNRYTWYAALLVTY